MAKQTIKTTNERIDALESKMDKILSILENGSAPKSTTKGSGKKPTKKSDNNYEVVASAKDNRQKVYDLMKKDGKEYDRNTYKKYAKKLGVWSDTYNRVVGTYK